MEWADTAKGLSILGVCLMHIVTAVPDGKTTPPGLFSSVLDPLRMPLFFLVSGLFAHRVLERTLGDLWYRRLWYLLVPYLVFTPFQALIRLDMRGEANLPSLIKAILFGDPGLWFLYTLMVYNLAAWALRKLPPIVAFSMSFVPIFIGIMTGLVQTQSFRQAFIYMPIFFAGLHFRDFFFKLADEAGTARVIITTGGIFVLWEVIYRYTNNVIFEGWDITIASQNSLMALVRTFTAIPFGIVLAVGLNNVPVINRFLRFVGANTLPIYVSHHAFMWLFMDFFGGKLVDYDPQRFGFLMETYPRMLVGILAVVTAGMLFYKIGKTPYIKWVLYPPALPGAPGRKSATTSQPKVSEDSKVPASSRS